MKKRLASLITCTMIVTSVMPSVAFGANFEDTVNHWAEEEIDEWSQLGIIQGYDGVFRPNEFMSRGEFAVVLDRLMKYQNSSNNTFSDLKDKYYTDAILKANYANIINGSDNTIRPEDKITREEAATILARAFNITIQKGNTTFTDNDKISPWAMDSINTLHKLGYIQGKQDNKFEPKECITRGEIIKLFDNMTSEVYIAAGDYSENINGNVVINSEDVRLKNMTITGDLIIAEGVADGEIYLDKVTVTGNVYVKGGGENSIYFNSTTVSGSIIVNKVDGQIRIVATGNTKVDVLRLESGAMVVTKELVGGSIDKVVIPANMLKGQEVSLQGEFNTVENNASDLKLNVEGSIKELKLSANTQIKGNIVADKVDASEGVELTVNGEKIEKDKINKEETKTPGGSGGSSGSGSSGGSSGSSGSGSSEKEDKFKINFEGNGAATTPQCISVDKGGIAQLPSNPEREGYIFLGWYTDDKLTALFDMSKPITNNMTLYAKWKDRSDVTTGSCLIIFESNGGNFEKSIEVNDGVLTAELPTPTKKGCEFLGWYKEPELKNIFKQQEIVTEDIKLYAKWTGWQDPVAIDERFAAGYPKVEIVDGNINLKVKLKENPYNKTKVFMVVNQVNSHCKEVNTTSIIEGRVGVEDSLIYVEATPYLEVTDTQEHTINTNVKVSGNTGIDVYFALQDNEQVSEQPTKIEFAAAAVKELDGMAPRAISSYINEARNKIYIYFNEKLEKDCIIEANEFSLSQGEVKSAKIFNKEEVEYHVINPAYIELNVAGITNLEYLQISYKGSSICDTATTPNKVDEFTTEVKSADIKMIDSEVSSDGEYIYIKLGKDIMTNGNANFEVAYGTDENKQSIEIERSGSHSNSGEYGEYYFEAIDTPVLVDGGKYFVTFKSNGEIDELLNYAHDVVGKINVEPYLRKQKEEEVSPAYVKYDRETKELKIEFAEDTDVECTNTACLYTLEVNDEIYVLRGFGIDKGNKMVAFTEENFPFLTEDINWDDATLVYDSDRYPKVRANDKMIFKSGKPYQEFRVKVETD